MENIFIYLLWINVYHMFKFPCKLFYINLKETCLYESKLNAPIITCWEPVGKQWQHPGNILYIHPANERRRRYNVTPSLIGWVHTQNDPWTPPMWFRVLNPWVQWNFIQNASMFLKENTFEICLKNVSHVSHCSVLLLLINACFFLTGEKFKCISIPLISFITSGKTAVRLLS